MFKGLFFGLVMLASSFGVAAQTIVDTIILNNHFAVTEQVRTNALDWKVGEKNNYDIDMGFIKGTMVMSVREITAEGIWLDQNVDLGFAGKQEMQALIDPNTGETKKLLVGGKEQEIPKQNMEVVEVKEAKITVPAGTFDCIHARLKNKDNNEESNAWINPQLIPLSGMLKMVQPSQMGEVTIVLTSFTNL